MNRIKCLCVGIKSGMCVHVSYISTTVFPRQRKSLHQHILPSFLLTPSSKTHNHIYIYEQVSLQIKSDIDPKKEKEVGGERLDPKLKRPRMYCMTAYSWDFKWLNGHSKLDESEQKNLWGPAII